MAIRYWLLYAAFWFVFWGVMLAGCPDKAF